MLTLAPWTGGCCDCAGLHHCLPMFERRVRNVPPLHAQWLLLEMLFLLKGDLCLLCSLAITGIFNPLQSLFLLFRIHCGHLITKDIQCYSHWLLRNFPFINCSLDLHWSHDSPEYSVRFNSPSYNFYPQFGTVQNDWIKWASSECLWYLINFNCGSILFLRNLWMTRTRFDRHFSERWHKVQFIFKHETKSVPF